MGHLNCLARDPAQALALAHEARAALIPATVPMPV
jgi:hypothetical protein